jgi:glycerol uptake facilitator protein
MAIGMSFGGMHGYAINPARDLGPRLFAVLAGFKNNGLTDGSGVWLVPVVGPIIGALLGAWIYDYLIGQPIKRAHEAAQLEINQEISVQHSTRAGVETTVS